MKAIVYERYGSPDVLRVDDVARPVPRADEVLVQIRATTVNRLDCHTREANRSNGRVVSLLSRMVSGLRVPRRHILGTEFAGEVAAVGAGVTEFSVGDQVFGNTGVRFGTHAEFTCVPERSLISHKPAGTTFEEAAAVSDGALNGLWCLRGAHLKAGQSVLIYGASGAIGTAAVQLARHFGADVTAVCGTKNLELVRSLGAGSVIDYMREDFTKAGETYDVIFDAVGKLSFRHCRNALKPGGSYLATDGFRNLLLAPWTRRFGDKRVVFRIPPRYAKQDLQFIKELMETGRFRAVIDRSFLLEDIIEATQYVETQQKTGNVVLTLAPS